MSRLGLDLGTRRTGVALNPVGSVVLEQPTIEFSSPAEFLGKLERVISEHRVRELIVGLPHPVPTSLESLLELIRTRVNVPIEIVDETLTTKEAERQLAGNEHRSTDSDARAARLILEQYLARQGPDAD